MNNFKLLGILIVILIVSCKKQDDTIGLEVQPLSDKAIVYYDTTLMINSYTEIDTNVMTSNTSSNLLGSISESVYGNFTAGIFSHYRLNTSAVDFGTGSIADSMVLMIPLNYTFGDSNCLQNFKIYEVKEDILSGKAYYSNYKFSLTSNDLISDNIGSIEALKIYVDNKMFLRLKITNQNFIDKIFSASGKLELRDNNNFLNYMKGLYIVADKLNLGGAIMNVNMKGDGGGLILYYRDNNNENKTFTFYSDNNSVIFNTFEHYYYNDAIADIRNQISLSDTNAGKNICYVESTGGLKVRLSMPDLNRIGNGRKVIIHKAELVLNIDENVKSDIPVATKLGIVNVDENGINQYLLDESLDGESAIGGIYNQSKKQYVFDIKRHIQNVINNGAINNLYVMVKGSAIQLVGTAIKGGGRIDGGIRLKITYSII